MKQLSNVLNLLPEYEALKESLDAGKAPVAMSGITPVIRSFFANALHKDMNCPIVLVCAKEEEARTLARDLSSLSGEYVPTLVSRQFTFHRIDASQQWEHERLRIFHALQNEHSPFLVSTVDALCQRTMPSAVFADSSFTLNMTESYDLSVLSSKLTNIGYTRCEQVEGAGQFAIRGGILDVFSPNYESPIRVEFWGDDIDSMGLFDVQSQRRESSVDYATILPCRELLQTEETPLYDLSFPAVYDKFTTALDYIPHTSIILLCESINCSNLVQESFDHLKNQLSNLETQHKTTATDFVYDKTRLFSHIKEYATVYLDAFDKASYPIAPKAFSYLSTTQLPAYDFSLPLTQDDLREYETRGMSIVLLADSKLRAERLENLLRESGLSCQLDLALTDSPFGKMRTITTGSISASLELPSAKIAILTEGVGAVEPKKTVKKDKKNRLDSFTDLSIGDLIVHDHHGIARFSGLVKMDVDGIEKEYIKLQFAGSDILYLPATQLDLISKYIGSGENTESKRLSKLGGTSWETAKKKAKAATKDLAKGLIALYAKRQNLKGYAFSPDTPWQKEFEERFEYSETEDQLSSAAAIKRDMEREIPMDRLLCGDVGYGKTEVAFRAVMKCILDGKQAAILAPTTVLAGQHYLTAKQRFRRFPVQIELLSRSKSAKQTKDIFARSKDGSIDLLIGTHKLLQKQLDFKDLGLLIVDEEQRFGVTHKERLKELFPQVDVLTLSATPIPRTLNMALSGLRDMSTLEEPPHNRRPVQTYVLEYEGSVIKDALEQELARGGQVYYIHNRIESIAQCANRLKALLPDATVAVAHGKMAQDEISDIMQRMRENEIDILVCTTIIETGVDIPNVNTLIIENADHMGLSQLHQLRGRVGRSARRSYAYITYRQNKALSDIAMRRLTAIREFATFGSGFKIAMRDLEIRGAGNLLGAEQSGFLMSVGYDMYLRLLEEAVLEEQGKTPEALPSCLADLSVPASLPDSYIPSDDQRMDIYRRISRIRSEEDSDDLIDEMIDRYGDLPPKVSNLISIALLRSIASKLYISEIVQKDMMIRFTIENPNLESLSSLCSLEKYKNRLLVSPGNTIQLILRLKKGDNIIRLVNLVLDDFASMMQPDDENTTT